MVLIEVGSASATENDGFRDNFLRFTVTLSEAPLDSVTVNHRLLRNGTAVDLDLNNGFVNSGTNNGNGTLTFAPGETSRDIFVQTNGGSGAENDESFTLELFDPAGAEFVGNAPVLRATGVILDDDSAGSTLAVFVSDPVLTEGDSGSRLATFEVRLSQPAESNITMNYNTINGTAVADQDYSARSGTVSFAPGQDLAVVRIPVLGDTRGEDAETFSLVVTPPLGLTIDRRDTVGEALILDTDTSPGVEISIQGDAATENNDFRDNFIRFTVTLSEAPLDAVTVNHRLLRNGTAVDLDLNSGFANSGTNNGNGTVTFAPGQTTQSIFVQTNGGSGAENDESFTLELYDPIGAVLSGGAPVLRSTGIILDDDSVGSSLAVFVSDPVVTEGNSGARLATFEVRLSQPASSDITMSYTTADGTAVAGQDYSARSGTISFVTGQDLAVVRVPVLGDTDAEGAEIFSLVVTPPAGQPIDTAGAVGEALILDTDTSPGVEISVQGDAATEGNDFRDNFLRFTVTLSEPATDTVTVDHRLLRNGTADEGDLENGFTSTRTNSGNGTLNFAPGQTTASVFVQTNSDSTDERDETITLELVNPVGAVLSGGVLALRATGFLLDDDGVGLNIALAASGAQLLERSELASRQEVLVELSRPSNSELTFQVVADDGTATVGQDYWLVDSTVTFAPGQTTASVSVDILGDARSEGTERFTLEFTPNPGQSYPNVTIPPVTLEILNGPVFSVGPTNGNDTLTGTAGNDTVDLLAGNDRYDGLGGNDRISGGEGNDTIRGDDGNDNLRGEAGNDVMAGGDGNDVVNGGDGKDVMFGGSGDDLMFGGAGFDRMFGGSGTDRMFGGNANDIANGGSDNDIINTGAGNDLIFAQNGNDLVFAQAGNDTVFGGIGNDSVFGGAGNDTINVGAGNDKVFGGAGIDTITGAAGDDVLSGGGGGDIFVFAADQGFDRITDYTSADKIDISSFDATDRAGSNFDWRDAASSFGNSGAGANVIINWDGGGSMVLENTSLASITDADFIF